MKDLATLSGPWAGWSIQEGFRLTEKFQVSIRGTHISGEGHDVDGDFTIDGTHDPVTGMVQMIRRYFRAPKNPGQVGYPFPYIGAWNGYVIAGRWMMATSPADGGPFEMWPEREEDLMELAIQIQEHEAVGTK